MVLSDFEHSLVQAVQAAGGILKRVELCARLEEQGIPEGTTSGVLSNLCTKYHVLGQFKRRGELGTYVYLPGTKLPDGVKDYGTGSSTRNRKPKLAEEVTCKSGDGVWFTDKPGEFPICCVVNGKPWFFTIDSIKQLYSQFKLMEGAFK